MKSIDEFVVVADKMIEEYSELLGKVSACGCIECYKADRELRDTLRVKRLAIRDYLVLGQLHEVNHG